MCKTAFAFDPLPLSERMKKFRDASRARGSGATFSPRRVNLTRAFFELYPDLPYGERYARSLAYAIENEPVSLFDGGQLAGMVYQYPTDPGISDEDFNERWVEHNAWAILHERQRRELPAFPGGGGAPAHIGWRWDRLLERGVEGHLHDLRGRLAQAADEEARQLYAGAVILWESALKWADRHVAEIEARLETATDNSVRELRQLLEVCTRVPRLPPRTFREAVQFFHVQHLVVMYENPYGGNGPGRMDYYLWPYLLRDLEEGRTTMESAKALVDELWILLHERIQEADSAVEAVVPGGTHPDGSCSVNPLSYLMVESIVQLDQTHPSVYPRLCGNCPDDFVDLVARYLVDGRNRAQVYNDDVCVPAIVRGGVRREDASMYMAGGCMEISPQGMNCDLNFALTHNVALALELVLNAGKDLVRGETLIPHDRCLLDYADFDDLYAAFEAELAREYALIVKAVDIASECYAKYRPTYLLSSLVDDCLERGRDQQAGGARYHDYGFAPLGITSAADSLTGIKRAIFDEKFVSAEDMLSAFRSDFAGAEKLRARLRMIPRFGVENSEADTMMERVLASVCHAAGRQRTRFDGRLKPMIFNFIWTPSASARLGARGDGSRAGELIGHGLTPVGSAMAKGLTTAMNSATSLSHGRVIGGATTMWDLDPEWVTVDRVKAILRTFFDEGGMIFQGNMTSVKELEAAMDRPQDFPNLLVRVGGFSARFVTLSPELQGEIAGRRRHAG